MSKLCNWDYTTVGRFIESAGARAIFDEFPQNFVKFGDIWKIS